MKTLPYDTREIFQVTKQLGDVMGIWTVGRDGITKIIAYTENGGMAEVPWFAVFKGDFLSHRMDATNCSVVYKESNEKISEYQPDPF